MGTLAAGIKEIFETTKQSGTNVMLCGNDGTPDGHMTMAKLGETLGVPKRLEFVDLGLPSGTLWATRNLGAETPEDYGYYFSWGNVVDENQMAQHLITTGERTITETTHQPLELH